MFRLNSVQPLTITARLTNLLVEWSRCCLRVSQRQTDPRPSLKKALNNHYRSAGDIGRECGVPFKSATKLLLQMSREDLEIQVSEFNWIDGRKRKRRCRLYRVNSISREEQAQLLNSVMFSMKRNRVQDETD